MSNYALILSIKYPGSQWSMGDETYESLVWHDDTDQPTKAELETLWPTVQAEVERQRVDALRKAAYQQMSDPLFFKWQSGEATEQQWLDAREAVRKQYPN